MGVARHPPQSQKRNATMQEGSKIEQEDRDRADSLTDLIRTGAQQLIAQVLKAEVGRALD